MTDGYRGKYQADRNFFQFMFFMSYFPQIVQGPIARHDHLAKQFYEGHDFDYQRCAFGLQLYLFLEYMVQDMTVRHLYISNFRECGYEKD